MLSRCFYKMGLEKSCGETLEENAQLRRVVSAAQAFMNEIQCYSTGVSLMAEEDMVGLFAAYSEAKEELDAVTCVAMVNSKEV
jgi:hypothetical protein